ncbi:MAG: heme biosynthesis protein HemY [Bosea sp. (in: a-proteobacteria)]
MFRVLVYLAIIIALALGAVWLADRPGEVSIVWQGYRIETSVAVAAIGVAALAFVALLLFSLARFVLGLPSAFSFASKARRRARGFDAVSRGMVAVAAGDPVAARRFTTDARKYAANEPLALLLEAQTAQISGDRLQAETTFRAMLDKPETRTLGLRGLFVEARRRDDAVGARAFADEAVRRSPSLAWANDALLDFHSTSGDWAAARTAVERRAALRLSDKAEAKRQRAVLLAAEAVDSRENEPDKALATALEAVKLAPGLTPAATIAGRMLAERGDTKKAARLLEAAWKDTPHPDVAAAYITARPGDSAQDRLGRAEALLALRPADPEGVLAVAGTAIAARDFARARNALLPLVAGGASMRVCLLMADLEEAEHGAAGKVREWLSRATRAPHDAAWVADGVVSDRWLPVSPVSGRLDAFRWTIPPATLGASSIEIDDVMADVAEPLAKPVVSAAPVIEPVVLAPELVAATATAPVAPALPPAAFPVSGAPAAPVIFPVPHAPDDPGPEAAAPVVEPTKRRFRLFG